MNIYEIIKCLQAADMEKLFKWQIKFQADLDKRTNEELLEDYRSMVSYIYDSEYGFEANGKDCKEMYMIEDTILKRMKCL